MAIILAPISLLGLDDRGRAFVLGTRTRISMLVRDAREGFSVSDLHQAYPHLALAQIHAALAHYYSHQDVIDAEIDAEDRGDHEARARLGEGATRADLLARLRERTGGS